jgi:hypothetical protein
MIISRKDWQQQDQQLAYRMQAGSAGCSASVMHLECTTVQPGSLPAWPGKLCHDGTATMNISRKGTPAQLSQMRFSEQSTRVIIT